MTRAVDNRPNQCYNRRIPTKRDTEMSNYDNNDSGALFDNDRRTTDRHPNLRGSATVGGVEYWVSAWNKRSAGGKDYISLAFTPKDEQGGQRTPQTPNARAAGPRTQGNRNSEIGAGVRNPSAEPPMDFDDDIPF